MRAKIRSVICLAILVSPLGFAESFDSPVLEDAKVELVTFTKKKVAEVFNEQVPNVSLRWIDNNESGTKNGFALDYDWSRNWERDSTDTLEELITEGRTSFGRATLNAKLEAKGSYAFDDATNNQDLSKLGISFSRTMARTPYKNVGHNASEYHTCVAALDPTDEDSDEQALLCWDKYRALMPDTGRGTFAYSVELEYFLEGNQDFTEKHENYGANVTFVYEPSSNSFLQTINVFDWPFRLTRKMSDLDFNASYPIVSVSLEQVDPKDDEQRNALVGGKDSFDRVVRTVAFSTKVADYQKLPITFEMIHRVYDESDPSEAIKNAKLDEFEYNTVSLFFPIKMIFPKLEQQELFLTYSSGELPFDKTSGKAVSIGWKSNLEDVAKGLSSVFLGNDGG